MSVMMIEVTKVLVLLLCPPPDRMKIRMWYFVIGTVVLDTWYCGGWYLVLGTVVVVIVMTKLPVLLLCPPPDQSQCHRG